MVARADSDSLTHTIANTSRDSAGIYRCEAATNLPFLVQRNSHNGSAEFVLAVKFAPQIELSEIVRYTALGKQEDIQINVPSYPESKLECNTSQSSDLIQRTSYSDREFVADYKLVLSNLNQVHNETVFQCTATNEVGQRKLLIRLTAKAPTPQIVSSGETVWHNSYKLKWQHDKNAAIDSYQIQIVFRYDDDFTNSSHHEFKPDAQKGTVALVDQTEEDGQIRHSSVVLGLKADTDHDIQLRSCNKHGCSDYSSPIRVRTPKKGHNTLNDPNNPQKSTTGKSTTLASSMATLGIGLCLAVGSRRRPL